MPQPSPIGYARRGEAFVAYRTCGNGPPDLLLVNDWFSHVGDLWSDQSPFRSVPRPALDAGSARHLRQARCRALGSGRARRAPDARGVDRRHACGARHARGRTFDHHRQGLRRADGAALRGDASRAASRRSCSSTGGPGSRRPTTSRSARPLPDQARMLEEPYMPPGVGALRRGGAALTRGAVVVAVLRAQRGEPEHVDDHAALVVRGRRPCRAAVGPRAGARHRPPRRLDRPRARSVPGGGHPRRAPGGAARCGELPLRRGHGRAGRRGAGARDGGATPAASGSGARDRALHGSRRVDPHRERAGRRPVAASARRARPARAGRAALEIRVAR